mmetsp:Transcript_13759/g.19267  ORF Transcript_13759/g.19267 Transcript_13759/m.19267 type:complete len:138 (+) Transcript_13759:609-1022(+)
MQSSGYISTPPCPASVFVAVDVNTPAESCAPMVLMLSTEFLGVEAAPLLASIIVSGEEMRALFDADVEEDAADLFLKDDVVDVALEEGVSGVQRPILLALANAFGRESYIRLFGPGDIHFLLLRACYLKVKTEELRT